MIAFEGCREIARPFAAVAKNTAGSNRLAFLLLTTLRLIITGPALVKLLWASHQRCPSGHLVKRRDLTGGRSSPRPSFESLHLSSVSEQPRLTQPCGCARRKRSRPLPGPKAKVFSVTRALETFSVQSESPLELPGSHPRASKSGSDALLPGLSAT
jgi:hypothetical protein